MRDFIEGLNRYSTEVTGNPYIKFIVKKSSEPQKIKAYRKCTMQLYLHIPGKNILCLEYSQNVNMSNISEDLVWKQLEPVFYYEIIKWIMRGNLEEELNGLPVE